MSKIWSGLMLSLMVGMAGVVQAELISTFDNDLDGWRTAYGEFSWIESGGNQGGFLQCYKSASSGNATIIAPDRFLGDLSEYAGGFYTFDTKLMWQDPGQMTFRHCLGQLRLHNGSIFVQISSPTPYLEYIPSTNWETYAVPFTFESLEELTQQRLLDNNLTWEEFLSNITRIEFYTELSKKGFALGFDNIGFYKSVPDVSESPHHTPEPGTWLLLGIGSAVVAWRRRRGKRQ